MQDSFYRTSFHYNNKQQKRNYYGRSMIEMLGVLAIIAVLSVGGLVGYQRAVLAHKVNTTIYDISYTVANIHNLFHNQPSYVDLGTNRQIYMSSNNNTATKIANSAKIFPDGVVKNNYKNVFNGDIKLFASSRFKKNDNRAFVLEFWQMPQEACMTLVTKSWRNLHGLIAIKVRGSQSDLSAYFLDDLFEKSCKTKYQKGIGIFCAEDLPLKPSIASSVCDVRMEYFSLKFN